MARPALSKALLTRLARGPLEVEKAWTNARPALRRFVPGPGKWSLSDIVIHLLDTEVANAWRLRHIIGDENPIIEAFDENAWVKAMHYEELDPKAALSAYAALRLCNVELATRLTKAQLAREGKHVERGPISVTWVLERMAWHDDAHLAQIERNRDAFVPRRKPSRR